MGPKKVSFLIPTLKGGGAERVIVNLANQFAQSGNFVELVTLDPKGIYKNQVSQKVRIIDLGSTRALLSIFPLIKYLKKNKPDAIVAALDYMNVITLIAKLLSGVKTKFIVTEHSTLSLSVQNSKSFVMILLPKLMRCLYRYADNIVAVSSGVANDLVESIGIDKGKVKVIYNPVLHDLIEEKATEETACEWLKSRDNPVVLSVGRLTDAKDFATLIRAFGIVVQHINAKLIILGDGELKNSLEKLIRELKLESNVQLKGFVENPYSYMNKADVFVLSSKWEGLPNVLIEALSLGIKVISTDCKSGPREVLANGKYGALVPVGDINKLADEILKHVRNPNLSESKDELWTYLQKFKVEHVAKEYYDFIFKTNR